MLNPINKEADKSKESRVCLVFGVGEHERSTKRNLNQ